MPVVALLFDLDDTLHDRAASLRAFAADQHGRWFAQSVEVDSYIARFLALDANGHRPKAEVYACLLDEMGQGEPEVALLLADYNSRYHDFAMPRAGAVSTLEALRSRGVGLSIVSNGWTGFQQRTIAALGLADKVDVVLISEQEGWRKPDRLLFERAAERLGATPE